MRNSSYEWLRKRGQVTIMRALTIFIQRPYRQAPLLAKRCPHQSTRFKLRNQGLDLDQTTSPVHHSHFAHSSS